jgi:hypothetical protein
MPAHAEAAGVAAPVAHWRSRAFGIEIEGDFRAPGLSEVRDEPHGPTTRVQLASAEDLDRRWHTDGATRLLEEHFDDSDDAARSIDHLPGLGYRLYARHFGTALISEDGGTVTCAPPDLEPWSWQRFLVGRVLPWAAVLRGRELFHASAVAFGDAVVGFVGPTGAGKTSLAARLVLDGARLVTDDVLALESVAGGVLAHPGAGLLCVRAAERSSMSAGEWSRLGVVLGESGKTYVQVEREMVPRRLAGLFFLAPGGARSSVEKVRPDARLLLGSTFNGSLRTPERLLRQLDVCADLADQVPLRRLTLGSADGSAAAARLAAAEAHTLIA